MSLTKCFCRRTSAKDWNEWRWTFSFHGVDAQHNFLCRWY